MTGTRGDRIRTARELRGLSRDQLAAETGVNAKTIARIERGEVSSSSKMATLEANLNIPTPTTTPHDEWAREDLLAALHAADDLDLISELAQRLVNRRGANTTEPLGPEGYFRWATRDAPYPEPGNTTTGSNEPIADSGGLA